MAYLRLTQVARSGRDHVIYECPWCYQPKFYWNHTEGEEGSHYGTCFSEVCGGTNGKTRHLRQVQEKLGYGSVSQTSFLQTASPARRRAFGDQEEEPKQETEWKDETVWIPAEDNIEAYAFLVGEKLLPERSIPFFEFCVETREIRCKVRSRHEHSWMRRSIDAKGWRAAAGMEKKEFWFENIALLLDTKTLVLVEGAFDALKMGDMRYGAFDVGWFAILGTHFTDFHHWRIKHLRPDRVLLWFDPDRAGMKAINKIKRAVTQGLALPAQVVDYHKEPGDCTIKELRKVLGV